MLLGNLRAMAREAALRHFDDEVAAALDAIGDARAAALRDKLGGPGWVSAADVPEGTVFCAAARPRGVWWRREGEGCRSLPPHETGRLDSPAKVDAANEWERAGYVEARP